MQSSCTKDTPADEPATCQKQEPSQGLLDGPVRSSEQEQGLGTRRGAGWSWATPPLGGKALVVVWGEGRGLPITRSGPNLHLSVSHRHP